MGAVAGSVLLAAVILALITYYHQWTMLWKEWLTSVDHKKIGIMYIISQPAAGVSDGPGTCTRPGKLACEEANHGNRCMGPAFLMGTYAQNQHDHADFGLP
jgi:hypothetical protein